MFYMSLATGIIEWADRQGPGLLPFNLFRNV